MFDTTLYRERHRVEFFFNRLKQFRRVATRYEKTTRNYLAMVHVGRIRIWSRVEGAPRETSGRATSPDAQHAASAAPRGTRTRRGYAWGGSEGM